MRAGSRETAGPFVGHDCPYRIDEVVRARRAAGADQSDPAHVAIRYLKENGTTWIVDLLPASGLVKSRGEAKRLIQQGGVKVDEQKVGSQDLDIAFEPPLSARLASGRLSNGRRNSTAAAVEEFLRFIEAASTALVAHAAESYLRRICEGPLPGRPLRGRVEAVNISQVAM